VHPSSRAEEEAIRGVAAAQNVPCVPVALHEYNVHRDGSLQGLTAQEVQPDSKAAREINALWAWFSAEMHLKTSARMNKVT